MICETYNNELNPLIRYINAGIDPYDFMHLFVDWIEHVGGDPEDWGLSGDDFEDQDEVTGDPDKFLSQLNDAQRKSFIDFLENNAQGLDDGVLMPIYMHAYGAKLVKRLEWLVHFSDDAADLSKFGHFMIGDGYTDEGDEKGHCGSLELDAADGTGVAALIGLGDELGAPVVSEQLTSEFPIVLDRG